MRANVPRSFETLTSADKKKINQYYTDMLNSELDKNEIELQKIWLQFACIVLHDAFGFGKDRCMVFIGNWKRMYRRNAKLNNKSEQDEFLKSEMAKIFGESGYPYDWVDSLKNIE